MCVCAYVRKKGQIEASHCLFLRRFCTQLFMRSFYAQTFYADFGTQIQRPVISLPTTFSLSARGPRVIATAPERTSSMMP